MGSMDPPLEQPTCKIVSQASYQLTENYTATANYSSVTTYLPAFSK